MRIWPLALLCFACAGKAAVDGGGGSKTASPGAGGGISGCNCSQTCSVALCAGDNVCCGDDDGECGCRAAGECNENCQ